MHECTGTKPTTISGQWWGQMVVKKSAAGSFTQIIYPYSAGTPEIVRVYANGAWGAWNDSYNKLSESLTDKGVISGTVYSTYGTGSISAVKIGNGTALISFVIKATSIIPSATAMASIPFVTQRTSCLWCIFERTSTERYYYGRGSTLEISAYGSVVQNITTQIPIGAVLFGEFIYNY